MSKSNVSAQGENCSPIQRVKLKYRFRTNFIRVSTIFVEKEYLRYLFVISTLYNAWIFENVYNLLYLKIDFLVNKKINDQDKLNLLF